MSRERFEGKVAVVTGAASGIGKASAERLAAEGASVVVVDIDGAGAETVARALPTPCIAVQADVANPDDVNAYVERSLAEFGRIDLHHLNAGIFGSFATLPDVELAEFERVLGVNVRGVFLGLQAAFRCYREQHSTGSIVVTASIASLTGSADLIAYQTS